ncbi:MAG: Gfo/Idh/MocA family oxidoreductase [Verrucomicrobiales bacterium]|jgi:predicted dehydrogenase|nr:Gfo/Idh/MocA family oxidoreductase [Verrucomicrobiales bacterium]
MLDRRNFLKTVGLVSAGYSLYRATSPLALAQEPVATSANGKVNLACIGIGNRGEQIITEFAKTGLANIVALCDVDMGARQTQKMMAAFPDAKQFKDFRKMFDEMGGQIDAVSVAVPDHAHFPIAMLSLALGKHIYLEKPMTRTFHEAELLIQAAKKRPQVVTQVGNQGHSEANYFQFKAWLDAGIIKDVTAVTAHMNVPRRWHKWDVNISRLPEAEPIPETLDWDSWLAAVPFHDFNSKYHQGNWRCWYDFGMGALGDWGAHMLDTVHEFLKLGQPYQVKALKLDGHNDYFFPMASTIQFKFAARGEMPPLDITWYDGVNNLPPLPEGYGGEALTANVPSTNVSGQDAPPKLNPGKIIYSKSLTFKGGTHGSPLTIIPEEKAKEMAAKLPEVPKSPSNHFANFLQAVRGEEKTRSPFELNGPLSQVFCLGVIAQRLNVDLEFDANSKRITNNSFADAMLTGIPPRGAWEQYYKL